MVVMVVMVVIEVIVVIVSSRSRSSSSRNSSSSSSSRSSRAKEKSMFRDMMPKRVQREALDREVQASGGNPKGGSVIMILLSYGYCVLPVSRYAINLSYNE